MAAPASPAQIEAKREKYIRFDKLGELYTYAAVVVGLILIQLPFQFPFDKKALYLLMGFVALFNFVWFRLLPKKFSGLFKTLIYYFSSTVFVALAVHYTQGIQSFASFLYYLIILSAAAALPINFFVFVVGLIVSTIWVEAVFFRTASIQLVPALGLALLHTWSITLVAVVGRFVFEEESRVRHAEQSKNLQNVKQIDMVKNEFVFIISNKLKEPILTLQNYLDSAVQTKTQNWSKDLVDLVNKTRENSSRLASLVNDLSDLSRIESQKLRLDLKSVVLSQIIGSTLSDFSMGASEKGISLIYLPPKEELAVIADGSRLHEILANLIDNAIKYSPAKGKISVGFERDGQNARIQVKDEGFGIPEEAKAHLFEKFYRVNRSSSEPKGTGLGLFVTKELIERQGGKIWYDSRVGVGTSFYFTLPIAKANGK